MKVLSVDFSIPHGEKQKQVLQRATYWLLADPDFGSDDWDTAAMLRASSVAELVYAANRWIAEEVEGSARTHIVDWEPEDEDGDARSYHNDELLFALLAPYASKGDSVCVQIDDEGDTCRYCWYVAPVSNEPGAPLALFEKDVDLVPALTPAGGKLVLN